jgi:poly(A) polymerase
VQDDWKRRQAAGESPFPALQAAIDAAFDARIGDISGRGKLAIDMREIWMLQPRFERRASSSALALLEQPRFRAGLDFLRLRGEVGEAEPTLAAWWEALYQASDEQRRDILDGVREQRGPRRVKRVPTRGADETPDAGGHASADDAAVPTDAEGDTPATDAGPPRKRRRRRRKPSESAGSSS